ncbi:hypothetical protein AB6A40_010623 [Gnathostoma spinigerum]|uniref:Uncharacterized protein n=1 Tax=Gnathostoma spinigerum TaxID=75299 RepID=A0ABD6F1X5_9BILA
MFVISLLFKGLRRARSKSSEALMKTGEDSDEVQFNIEMERWENSLWQHFENRKNQEYELAKYIEKRIKWFEELKQHIVKIPVKSRHDGHRTVVPDKIKTLVKERYSELRKAKKLSLSKGELFLIVHELAALLSE